MSEDTGSCSLVAMPRERSLERYKERDERIAILLRDAILGDQTALGELCELYRPSIRSRCLAYLLRIRLESYTEDLTQDVILEVIKVFPKIDPYKGSLHGLIKTISMSTLYAFTKRNQTMLREIPLPDNEEAEGKSEFKPDPLDSLSRKAWEQDGPSKPISQANKFFVRRFSRAVTEERKRKKELQARPGSGNYKRDRRKNTVWETKRIQKNRMAYANGLEDPRCAITAG